MAAAVEAPGKTVLRCCGHPPVAERILMENTKYILLIDFSSEETKRLAESLNPILKKLGMIDFLVFGVSDPNSLYDLFSNAPSNIAAFIINAIRPVPEFPRVIKNSSENRISKFIFGSYEEYTPNAVLVIYTNKTEYLEPHNSNHSYHHKNSLIITSDISLEAFTKILQFIKSQQSKEVHDQETGSLDRSFLDSIRLVSPPWEEIRRYLASHPHFMEQMTPQQFEELAAEIFRSHGFDVELTSRTRDGGYDIIAIKHNAPTSFRVLVEAKRHNPEKPLNPGYVREIYGMRSLAHASQVCLVTM
jgi:hypothetical protein